MTELSKGEQEILASCNYDARNQKRNRPSYNKLQFTSDNPHIQIAKQRVLQNNQPDSENVKGKAQQLRNKTKHAIKRVKTRQIDDLAHSEVQTPMNNSNHVKTPFSDDFDGLRSNVTLNPLVGDQVKFTWSLGDSELFIEIPKAKQNKLYGKFRLFFNSGNIHMSTHSMCNGYTIDDMSLNVNNRMWTSLVVFDTDGNLLRHWREFDFTIKQHNEAVMLLSQIAKWFYRTWSLTILS